MNRTLAPKSLEGILSETFTIYKNNFLRLIAMVSIVAVPFTIVYLIVNLLFPAYGEGATKALSNAIISIPLFLASFVAFILMGGAVIHAVSEQYFNQPVNIGRAYSFAWHRTGDMFWAMFLAGLAIGGIFLAATIISVIISIATGGFSGWQVAMAVTGILILIAAPPAIYLGIIWTFMLQAALLEGCGPTAALSHSSALVKRNWWRVLGIVLLLLTIVSAINMILYIPAMMGAANQATTGFLPYTTTEPTSWTMIAATIGGLIGNIICIPIFTIGETLLYFDLRVRKQGYSLDALANELGLGSTSIDTVA
jgi:MFS family permease